MSGFQEELVKEFYEPMGLLGGIGVGSFLSGAVKGIPLVTEALKAGKGFLDSFSGLKGVFGTRTKVVFDTSKIEGYLRNISTKLDDVYSLNQAIFSRLELLEGNILLRLDQGFNLDAGHVRIEEELSTVGKIDAEQLSKPLFRLAKIEYRPSKVRNLVKGFEAFILNYPSEDGDSYKGLDITLMHSRTLEYNLRKLHDLQEEELVMLTGLLLSFHKIAVSIGDFVVNPISFEDEFYVQKVKGVDYFDLKPYVKGTNKTMDVVVELHEDTKRRLISILDSYALYRSIVLFISEYNATLETDRQNLLSKSIS